MWASEDGFYESLAECLDVLASESEVQCSKIILPRQGAAEDADIISLTRVSFLIKPYLRLDVHKEQPERYSFATCRSDDPDRYRGSS